MTRSSCPSLYPAWHASSAPEQATPLRDTRSRGRTYSWRQGHGSRLCVISSNGPADMKGACFAVFWACASLAWAAPPHNVAEEDIPDVDAYLKSLNQHDRSVLNRVIGGDEIEQGDWPWLVSLKGDIPTLQFFGVTISSTTFYCGASLLNDRWVLTAAHCFMQPGLESKSSNPKYWTAKMGDVDLESGILESIASWFIDLFDDPVVWEIDGKKIIVHPNYDPDNRWHNDIALMKLEEDVPSSADDNADIQAVRLPAQGDADFPVDGAICVMKGWGCTQAGGSVSEIAMAIEIPKVNDNTCASTWGIDTETRVCAGYNLNDIGICPGDSGGPLVAQNEDGQFEQVGIASFTSANQPGNWPGVFTRVSYYVDWINEKIQNN